MDKKSKIILTLVILIMLVIATIFTEMMLDFIYFFKHDKTMSKEDITTMVIENKTKISEVVDNVLELSEHEVWEKREKLIAKLWAKRKIDNIEKCVDENNQLEYIDFFCGRKGKERYCGFYYSDDDLPRVICGEEGILEKSDRGWSVERSDSIYYTEKITDNYFYYEDIY